ncbi:MAG: RNA 2',3'-cyclic phosphodiesterase [Candidatus Moranbacteria bacterium]|nr:RNA 2',3'-cyclic phosphodiesterase [Candidatus Moranbacteria bacterium]
MGAEQGVMTPCSKPVRRAQYFYEKSFNYKFMKRKLFLGIDIDSHLKKMLDQIVKKNDENLPIKWYRKESYHITLIFLGWVDEDLVIELSEKFRQACAEFSSFDIQFEKIKLAYKNNTQENNPCDAKMIWLEGKASEELKELQKMLEESLDIHYIDKKSFRPHVTLGRMRAKQWAKLEKFPNLEKDFEVSMDVMSITLFESGSKEGSPDYTPIDVFELGDFE